MKYIFRVNNEPFGTAQRAARYCYNCKKEQIPINRIEINNEVVSLATLEEWIKLEKQEAKHNKEQGL